MMGTTMNTGKFGALTGLIFLMSDLGAAAEVVDPPNIHDKPILMFCQDPPGELVGFPSKGPPGYSVKMAGVQQLTDPTAPCPVKVQYTGSAVADPKIIKHGTVFFGQFVQDDGGRTPAQCQVWGQLQPSGPELSFVSFDSFGSTVKLNTRFRVKVGNTVIQSSNAISLLAQCKQ
jgi:hypothetical protein